MKLPDGVHELRAGRTAAFAAPDVEAWVRAALERGEGLHEAASRDAEQMLRGRGPVPVFATARGRWVVRHYHRGGRAAPVLFDRYLRFGPARPVREVAASRELRRRGIPTPRVVAGAIYSAGPFYRADLVTEFVPDAVDLHRFLFEEHRDRRARVEAIAHVGRLVARAAAAGIEHRDLNARNILVESPPGGPVLMLIDLDRCRVLPPGVPGRPRPMLSRLRRSLRRDGDRTGRPVSPEEWAALTEAERGWRA